VRWSTRWPAKAGGSPARGEAEAFGSRSRTGHFGVWSDGEGDGLRKRSTGRPEDNLGCRTDGDRGRGSGSDESPAGSFSHGYPPPTSGRRVFSDGLRTGDGASGQVFGPGRVSRTKGSRETEPHGREWLKQVTGLEEGQTVKVVKNGEGGPQRVWKPATRRSRTKAVRAAGGRPSREVDSSSWERRRGGRPYGRRDVEGIARIAERVVGSGRRSSRGPRGRAKVHGRYPGRSGN
jgi:hypothetical protein